MQYLLTPEEYEDLKARAIPKEVYEQWRKDMAKNTSEVSHDLVQCITPMLYGQTHEIQRVKEILKRLSKVKLPHEQL